MIEVRVINMYRNKNVRTSTFEHSKNILSVHTMYI